MPVTHHAEEHKGKLYNISVGHRVEPPQQGVDDGNSSRDPDAQSERQIQGHTQESSCQSVSAG